MVEFVSGAYILAALLFILALAGLSKHETARRGNAFGMAGMGLALVATLLLVLDYLTDDLLVDVGDDAAVYRIDDDALRGACHAIHDLLVPGALLGTGSDRVRIFLLDHLKLVLLDPVREQPIREPILPTVHVDAKGEGPACQPDRHDDEGCVGARHAHYQMERRE